MEEALEGVEVVEVGAGAVYVDVDVDEDVGVVDIDVAVVVSVVGGAVASFVPSGRAQNFTLPQLHVTRKCSKNCTSDTGS